MNKNAFTLAEILITVLIIGVVAAMTIPSLLGDTNDKELVTGVQKANTTLTNAIKLAETKHGPARFWGYTDAETHKFFQYIMLENMKFNKICENKAGCLGDGKYYNKDGTQYTSINAKGYGNLTSSAIGTDGITWIYAVNPDNKFHEFWADVNGSNKGPNIIGVDMHRWYWYPNDQNFYPADYTKNVLFTGQIDI